jgi:hypothetical protein
METVNQYFELIEDDDLQSDKGYHSMILRCPSCKALMEEKACGDRTIFPWFGYHPTDGNCSVITDEFAYALRCMAYNCTCKERLIRITTKEELSNAICEALARMIATLLLRG